ncbi:hypothetical protein MPH_07610 [Macrophomina phaseolina MS6]|uniref:Uncharacterized protein n=1 Tax=Macrophomina phaseolina (strain MS6) TaxID=1126212 RepID=K2RYA0_MACPH|nr:hypothetical protein MPH_07610 [Macrophomina phaseolina MS6]
MASQPDTPPTREEAQRLIAQVRKENGGISPEHEALLKENCPDVLEALQNVRRKLGSATKTLATNLYSKDTRFLYELIQNAEDNQYCVWTTPFLNFILYPDKIVIDSNENGFTSLNFKAICSTGESTKTNVQGYVGEKGIGFKSVFKVAKKVHIQSGVFSFSFVYTRDSDDDGLGMVTPLSEPYEDLPANVRTRMTLTLLRPEDFMQRAADLSNLPDTLLLFLSKIRSINVRICSSANTITTVHYKHVRGSDNLEKILKSIKTYDGTTSIQTKLFLVTRRVIRNLPFDPARKHTNQATIILAFPVDVNDTPILENQHVFAYLPLRRVGFKVCTSLLQIIEENLSSAHDIITSGDPAVDEVMMFALDSLLQLPAFLMLIIG